VAKQSFHEVLGVYLDILESLEGLGVKRQEPMWNLGNLQGFKWNFRGLWMYLQLVFEKEGPNYKILGT
jgi:hypothetical protein